MTFASPPPTVPPADAWHNCAPVAFIDTPERRGLALPRRLHFDCGVRPEMVAVMSMMLREPVANTTPVRPMRPSAAASNPGSSWNLFQIVR
jgi:hypothetical protein